VKPDGTLFQWKWLAQMLMNCTDDRYAVNKSRMVRLAEYSRDRLIELRGQIDIPYEGRQQGTLQVFRTNEQLEGTAKDIAVLKELGVPFELLTRESLVHAEPALYKTREKLTGGLRLPNDETGDANLFTTGLAKHAGERGVRFLFNRSVDEITYEAGSASGVVSNGEHLTADQFVVAAGSYSTLLLRTAVEIPVYPVKGFSITVPISDPSRAPVSTVLDETYKVAITRFADRIRVGGMANLVGFDKHLYGTRRETLEFVVTDLFPESGDVKKASFWTGFRPMTPDGTPIIGPTRVPNLWLNVGHGTLGWTMACGSASVLADLMSGKNPDIRADDLAVSRYES